jgi:cell division transport system permease protein
MQEHRLRNKEQAAKQHTDIIRFYDFLGETLQNSFDIHLKADYAEKIALLKLKNLQPNVMISILYDKQLVNLVNDNIKKVSMWILI